MERIKRKKKRLYAMFISFLFRFGILAIGLAGLTAVVYMVTVRAGVVRLPSYELDKITRAEGEIRSGGQVEEKLLPDTCRYGVFEKDGTYVYGNLSKEEQEGLWKSQMQSSPALIYGSYWKVIEKENGLTALVEYQVIAKFSNPFLRSVFPNAELLFVGAYFLMFFGTAVALAKRQGKYLQKRLNVLKETAERVEREDLDFEREYSDIQEVDHVLGALYQMKEALQKSLKEQWDIKRQKEDQIASLAHDIKTPLTIIRGNTELLLEEETEEEKREWDQEILDNVREIERYLQILQRTIRQFDGEPNRGSKDGQEEKKEEQKNFPASFWIQEICERAQALGRTKKLQICCRAADTDKMIYGRKEECSRALWNIVSNGVDFSPRGGELLIEIKESGEFLAVTVTDDGPGFTKEGLAHATEQFYQADKSRTRKDHYGMGLYIASEIMKEYKGFLQLENEEGRGGKVSLYFRCV
ncbi:two-component sensor histidine kinase [Claveliimonas bilis]|uniref:HAMP domain-containing sensor histidine kinase n=1 Tax=Claveliimonas bilis TaxID=3028070 RepID=UPI001E453808|nr:HAMP domain-containing sensor histidine kinase [Claveliimonas bilis]BCZ26607.1 two-component sensor histidine kinase [Claveliimonas bilis]